MKSFAYRADIDGLRAISVLSVIFYHLDFTLFSGGYIGVDIFFTISGYLITSIIIFEKNKNNFSYTNFLNRRIRRIIPILILVIFFTLIVGVIFSMPTDLNQITNSAIFSILFTSNFYFSIVGDVYAAKSIILKPLAHTWSLSIEEQYYIFFPLLFIFFNKEKILNILIIFIFLSLSISFIIEKNYPHHNFYFTPSRVWELLLGCCIAILKFKNHAKKNDLLKDFFCTLGIILILIPIFFFKIETFSTLKSFIPISGTCMILYYGYKNNWIISILSKIFFVKIGLLSYSLYLWHYPIISFFEKYNIFYYKPILKIIVFFVILLFISILFYFLVEKNFRSKKIISNSKFYTILFFVLFSLSITFASIHFSNSFVSRYMVGNYNLDNDNHYLKWLNSSKQIKDFKNLEKNNVLVVGDSHGLDTYNSFILNKNLFNNYEFSFYWIQINEFKDFLDNKLPDNFKPYTKYSIDKLKAKYQKADTIILSSSYPQKRDFLVLDELSILLTESKKRIIFTTLAPKFRTTNFKYFKNYSFADKWILSNRQIPKDKDYIDLKKKYYSNMVDNKNLNKEIINVSIKYNFDLIHKEKILCNFDNKECDFLTKNNQKILWDGHHYTIEGAKHIGKIIYNRKLIN